MIPAQRLILVLMLIVLATGLAACGQPTPESTPPPEPVRVQLSWFHNVEFAGFYMAQDKGFYAEQGLDVELVAGGIEEDGNVIIPVDEVTSGAADFGVSDGGALLLARAEGAPVVAIATIYQLSPVTFTSLAENNIRTPQDLIGKTVSIDEFGSGPIFRALLSSQGIDPADINIVQRTDFSTNTLTNGEVDVLDGWITNEVTLLEAQGVEVNIIMPSEYGIDMYPDVIFTTEDTLANRPDLVQAFITATLRGIQAALDDPDRAAALAVAADPSLDLEGQKQSMLRSLPLLDPPGSYPGAMRAEVWELTMSALLEQGILSEPVDYQAAYTTAFVEAAQPEPQP